ncbi:MAG: hypothetical protein Q8882_00135 [Bacillota bacterium]|nr:hypothetical protein [Bacillota bacterium]
MAKKEKNEYLIYNGKPFIRGGNTLYFGDPKDRYIVKFIINHSTMVSGEEIADSVTIQLITNTGSEKERVIKQAERDGLYKAIDIGEYWLEDALEKIKPEG